MYCTPHIKKLSRSLLKNENKKIILMMEKVDYIDSSGLGMLTNLHFECKQQDIKLKLAKLSNECEKIFSLTKMNRMFEIYASLEDAIAAMND